MARELNLYVDSERGALVSGFTSTIPATVAPFKFGDSVPVTCRVLTPDTSSSIRPYKEFDLTNREIRLGIGVPAGLPTVGTFTLTYGANTTSALAFDADAAAVQTALNALASITSAGGVTVTKPNDGVYRIVFNTAGDRTAISGDTSSLYPTTGAFIGAAQQGTGSLKEIVLVSLETQPAAYVLLEDELPAASIGVTVVRAGGSGVGEIQTIDLSSPEPYDGTFSLEIDGNSTPAISYNALPEEVQSAIESASEDYVGEVTVTGTFPRYTISFGSDLGAIGAMSADASDLVVPKGRKGSLNLNTTGVIELLNGEASATAKLEIEILDLDDSTPWTVIQQDVTVNQDVIPNSPASQTPLPTYIDETALDAALEGKADAVDNTKANLVSAGDSLSVGQGDPEEAPVAILGGKSFLNGSNVYNTAVNGRGITDVADSYTDEVYPYRPTGSIERAYLMFWVGANNYAAGSSQPLSAADFIEAWDNYITQAKSDGFKVIAFTVPRRTDAAIVASDEAIRQEINNHIRTSTLPDYLIDTDSLFPNPDDLTWYAPGGIHINIPANYVLASIINGVLTAGGSEISPQGPFLSGGNTWREKQRIIIALNGVDDHALILDTKGDISTRIMAFAVNGSTKHCFFQANSGGNFYLSLYDVMNGVFVWKSIDGNFEVGKSITRALGPFADNAAAALGGISAGGDYRHTDGTIHWRNT